MSGVAIVTGGGSGIGRAVSLALARAGWRVVLAGRKQSTLDAVCATSAATMIGVATDVADEHSVVALFDRAVAHFGRARPVVQQCGHRRPVRAHRASVALADFSAVLAVNLTGAFLCARRGVPPA